eukprot:jgi/Tetstr1/421946/TSEL_012845.t1
MAGGKKAADPTKATPADSLAETPAEPTETTRDTTALLQALALKVDALSTRLDEHDNNKHKEQRDIPSDDDEVGQGGKEPEHNSRIAAATGGACGATAVFIDPRDWEDLLPRAYQDCPSPLRAPHARAYGGHPAMATLRAPDTRTQDRVDALDPLDAAHRTLEAVGDANEAGLTYLRRFKAKKALTPEEQVADERLIYSRVFDTAEHERSANVVDGLLVALEDNRLGVGLAAAAKAQASTTFNRQAAERDTTASRRGWTRTRLLPMGWSVSPYYFTTFTMTFVEHLRSPTTPAALGNVLRSRRWRWRGARILPYVDDFLLFALSEPEALELRQRVADLLDSLGMLRNPAKGLWEPVEMGQHLGSLAGRAQYLYLANPAARFYLRELHDVVGSKCGGRVRRTHQLRRWWTAVPTQSNSRPIHRHVETAYMHCDSSGYGWGAVLNGRLEARGFWGATDERQHITRKELKAVRLAVESFLPHLAGRRVLLHEDNQAVCSVLAGLTSRSPEMIAELRKLWYLLDSNGVVAHQSPLHPVRRKRSRRID